MIQNRSKTNKAALTLFFLLDILAPIILFLVFFENFWDTVEAEVIFSKGWLIGPFTFVALFLVAGYGYYIVELFPKKLTPAFWALVSKAVAIAVTIYGTQSIEYALFIYALVDIIALAAGAAVAMLMTYIYQFKWNLRDDIRDGLEGNWSGWFIAALLGVWILGVQVMGSLLYFGLEDSTFGWYLLAWWGGQLPLVWSRYNYLLRGFRQYMEQ